jgi:short-subunit dehydrogenase
MSVLIFGADSLISQAAASHFAKAGEEIIFCSRAINEPEKIAKDFEIRYNIKTYWEIFDALKFETHKNFIDELFNKYNSINYVLIAIGYLGEQKKAEENFEEARKIIDTNYTSVVSLSELISSKFEERKKGNLAVISSVAGDRGRQSNYMYGSSKGGLTVYLSGLRSRMQKNGVNVLTIKPGFVNTPMTYGMKFPKILASSPEKVGKDIYKAIKKQKSIIYTPFYWRWIMMIIKSLPEFIFKKLNF